MFTLEELVLFGAVVSFDVALFGVIVTFYGVLGCAVTGCISGKPAGGVVPSL
jgi:hypothetical protein